MGFIKDFTRQFFHRNIKAKTRYASLQKFLNIKYKNQGDFYFFQIGAHDGISHDFIYDFLKTKNVYGVAIEPISDYYTKLVNSYAVFKNLNLLNFAIHKELTEIKIYRVSKEYEPMLPDWAPGSASFSKEHLLLKCSIPERYISYDTVSCISLDTVFEKFYPYDKIDLLQIDTEGYDFEILKMVDFTKVKPQTIKLEYSHLNMDELREAQNLLLKNNYLSFIEGNDLVGYRASEALIIFLKAYKKIQF